MDQYTKYYIIAGTAQEYEAWLRRKNYDRIEYVYIRNLKHLQTLGMGLYDIKGFYIGTYNDLPEIEEMKAYIESRKRKHTYSDIGPTGGFLDPKKHIYNTVE